MLAGSWRGVNLQGMQQNQQEDIWKKILQCEKKCPLCRGNDWFLKLKLEARRGKNITTFFLKTTTKKSKYVFYCTTVTELKSLLIPVPSALSLQTHRPSASLTPRGCRSETSCRCQHVQPLLGSKTRTEAPASPADQWDATGKIPPWQPLAALEAPVR